MPVAAQVRYWQPETLRDIQVRTERGEWGRQTFITKGYPIGLQRHVETRKCTLGLIAHELHDIRDTHDDLLAYTAVVSYLLALSWSATTILSKTILFFDNSVRHDTKSLAHLTTRSLRRVMACWMADMFPVTCSSREFVPSTVL
ncbi:unnamed protein product [Ectocarpus sp. 13 AM-2016]